MSALSPDQREQLRRRARLTTCHHADDDRDTEHTCSACLSTHLEPVVAQMLADERERIAREIETDAARAWGGDASWLTSGSKVAALVAEWIRSD